MVAQPERRQHNPNNLPVLKRVTLATVGPRVVYAALHLEVVCTCGTRNSWAYLVVGEVARCRWCGAEIVARVAVERRGEA